MVTYTSSYEYLSSCQSYRDKAAACDKIIAALLLTMEKAALGEHISEYSIDNGQSIIKTVYKGTEGIVNAIKGLEKLKAMYELLLSNRTNGNVFRLVDSNNLVRGNGSN